MNERHFGGSSRAAVAGFKKPRTYLSGDFRRDMKELRILGRIRNPQKRTEVDVDETPQFVTYLTLALENLSNILGKGKDLSGHKTPDAVLKELADEKKLVLMLAHKTAYCPAFMHLMVMLKTGIIGDIVDINASITTITD